MFILMLLLISNLSWAAPPIPCPPVEITQSPVVSEISEARSASAQLADPSACESSDIGEFCSEKTSWLNETVYAKSQNPLTCQKYANKNIRDVPEAVVPECVVALKEKFKNSVVPWIKKTYNEILNHSDYVQQCCRGDNECSRKMHSVPLNFLFEQESTGYDEKAAPGAVSVGYMDAASFDPEIEKGALLHELGHACHETLVTTSYDNDIPRARAMEKLISERFGKDFLECVQQEFGKYFPDWKNPKNYGAGINRLYNETFAEAFLAPLAPNGYQGVQCKDQNKISYYYPAMVCRWKIARLKKQWCH